MRWSLILIVFFAARAASAQTTEQQSARSLGMGGAFRGMAFDNSAIDLNPAGIAQVRRFNFEGGYLRSPDDGAYGLHVAIADSLTNATATGLSIDYGKRRPDGLLGGDPGIDQQRYIAAVAFAIVPQKVWMGFNTKMIVAKYPDSIPKRKSVSIITNDFGVLYRPFQMLAIGATFDNLVDGGHREAPRSVTGGVAVLPTSWLALTGDAFVDLASTDEDETGWAVGVQLSPFRNFALRGGAYEHPLTHDKTWTFGVGLLAETGSIDYSVRTPPEDTEILTHFVSISFFAF